MNPQASRAPSRPPPPRDQAVGATAAPLPPSTYPTERLGALSDGVFAIALTLLVLELKIPELPQQYEEQRMLVKLEGQLPNFLAWMTSFVLLARFWTAHHNVVADLSCCSPRTLRWNFLVLALVSLIPFAASLIGTYESDPIALSLFSLTVGATGLTIGGLARHVATQPTLQRRGRPPSDSARTWKYHSRVLPGFALASTALLAVHEVAALAIWLLEPFVAQTAAHSRRTELARARR